MPDSDVFDLFLDSRVALGCSIKTIKWYKFHLRHYGDWLAANSHTYTTTKLLDLQMFLAHMRKSYSASTTRQAATTLICFYRWCIEVELIVKDPTIHLKRPKVPEHIPPIAARSYVQHMLEKIRLVTWIDHRDKLIIHILACTGLRVSECANLRVVDVDMNARRLAVLGKGSRVRFQPFPHELVQPLFQWLHVHRPQVLDSDGKPAPWLFFSATSRGTVRGPITKQAIYETMKTRAENAALDWIPPHGYRHGFAVEMLKMGASTRLIQALLGHANIATTEKYLKISPDLVQGMFDELWQDIE